MSEQALYPYLCVADTARAIEFYRQVFGATELFRLVEPGGRIGHAEVDIDGTTLMLCDEFPELDIRRPDAGAGYSTTMHLHVDDADAVIARAVEAGATVLMAPADAFYGERSGVIRDPFGHRWNIGHSIEDITPAEMQRRYTAMMASPDTD
ncbi:VOC family protein [Luteimonas kalidii]|uniref:VOC family protein n=1 Tax=Luteimonas kalidii TaxID=3042025 RepID=A0ABT6JRY9_9GAMM|nr:VOC family protein [Luteimonas kalidii]MDH5833452.1 VOC family protein [Luteimonas kalidii]